MGTSASSTGPNNKSPLIPPWAEQSDSISFGNGNGASDSNDDVGQEQGNESEEGSNNEEVDNGKIQEQIPGKVDASPRPNRLVSARTAFGNYAGNGGTSSNLRSSLKKYAKGSGGRSGTAKRLASGITAGTSLFRMLSGDSVSNSHDTLSLSELNGQTVDQAIDKITEHLTPENGDADSVRVALDYALVEALPDDDSFDESMINEDVIHDALSCYLTDLIYQDIVEGMGRAWFKAEHASKHHSMENELRELVKVVTQEQVEKLTHGNAGNITKENINKLQIDAISQTVEVWESFDD